MGAIKDIGKEIERSAEDVTGAVTYYSGSDAVVGALEDTEDFLNDQDAKDAAKEAAAAQEDAAQQGIDFGREQYADFLGFTQPYREAGESFLPQLIEFLDPEVQEQFKADALAGQEFQGIKDQANESLISNAAAFGGLRSSGTQDRIIRETSTLANQFGQNAVNNRLSQLQGGVNLGLSTLGTTMQGLGQAGGQIQTGIQNLGNAQATSALADGMGFNLNDALDIASTVLSGYGSSQA
jgi:hypothetical protein